MSENQLESDNNSTFIVLCKDAWSFLFHCLQIGVIMWLLHRNLGGSALVGGTMFLLATPVQFVLAGMQAKIQKMALVSILSPIR